MRNTDKKIRTRIEINGEPASFPLFIEDQLGEIANGENGPNLERVVAYGLGEIATTSIVTEENAISLAEHFNL